MNKNSPIARPGRSDLGRFRPSPGLLLLAVAVMTLAVAPPAHATGLVINPTFDSSITSDPNAATIEATITSAIGTYETTFSDSITVNITFREVSSGLGGSSTFVSDIPYVTYLAALTADASSANDATALASLPAGPNNPVNGSPKMLVVARGLVRHRFGQRICARAPLCAQPEA